MAQMEYTLGAEQEVSFEPVPNGDYLCAVVESEVKRTKTDNGTSLYLTWDILEGPYKGRKIFETINYNRDNAGRDTKEQQTQNIARGTLNAILACAGLEHLRDTNELHGKAMMLKVVVKQNEGYDPRNDVKKHYAAKSSPPPQMGANMANQGPPPQNIPGVPPGNGIPGTPPSHHGTSSDLPWLQEGQPGLKR